MSPHSPRPGDPIELAPNHKLGLTLPNPVLLASGVAGYGDALGPGLDLAQLGGLVTAPLTRRPWHGQPPAALEVPGGLLWQRGPWNPGVRRVVRDFGPLWRRSPVPVIVHIAGSDPGHCGAAAAPLEEAEGVAGLELDVPVDGGDAAARVWAVRDQADLPLLVRLPLHAPDDTVRAVVEAGADCLVLAQPPQGWHLDLVADRPARGGLHGPSLAPQVAARLVDLAAWVEVPLVACGGVFDLASALAFLAAGARAIQVDVGAWIDPLLPGRIAAALTGQRVGS